MWNEYIQTKERTKLKTVREETTLLKSKEFLETQVARTLTKVYKAYESFQGVESANAYINYLLALGLEKMNNKDYTESKNFQLSKIAVFRGGNKNDKKIVMFFDERLDTVHRVIRFEKRILISQELNNIYMFMNDKDLCTKCKKRCVKIHHTSK